MLLFEKFWQHQPLNRQAERYAREGVPLILSTLANQVGATCPVQAECFTSLPRESLARSSHIHNSRSATRPMLTDRLCGTRNSLCTASALLVMTVLSIFSKGPG